MPRRIAQRGLAMLIMCATSCGDAEEAEGHSSQSGGKAREPNRLVHEKSPYLLQHAHNPVDWYPWGEEAFAKAQRGGKPVFLSIGYSTCHWCHVMERESFEDDEIAGIMNEHFVCIKVDREERPDIDNVYMTAAQAMSGGGGWPLSIFMTPDKKPFFSGTYFPPDDRQGHRGFKSVLLEITKAWESDRSRLEEHGSRVALFLNQPLARNGDSEIDETVLARAHGAMESTYEPQYGGFSNGNKFPMGHGLSFLLRYYERSGDGTALDMVTHTLDNMAAGGLYDHLGGGFHRYSTDIEWLVPHFEKMLYDQALLVGAYLEAYQITGREHYARIARETLAYVMRDMRHRDGGFYSAEDADSEGEEGRFYVWTRDEILALLGSEEGELFCGYYGVEGAGNFEGKAILTARLPEDQFSDRQAFPLPELHSRLEISRQALVQERAKRIRPHLDDKIMTDWNGLMISALSMASRVLGDSAYASAAAQAADFVLREVQREDGRLLKYWRDGSPRHLGLVEDYAFLVNGLIDLYAATFEPRWLTEATRLADDARNLFWDDENGGFFFTPRDGERLITNPKELYDGAIPSGNSVGAYAFLRLGHLLFNGDYTALGERVFASFSAQIERSPSAFPMLLTAYDYSLGPKREIVIAGESDDAAVEEFLAGVSSSFLPRTVVVLHPPGDGKAAIERLAPHVGAQAQIDGRATFYVCENYACKLPTTGVAQALATVRP